MQDQLNKIQTELERAREQAFQQAIKISTLEWEIKGKLDSIQELLLSERGTKETVIAQQEKHKITEARLENIEKREQIRDDKINSINLKIAMVSGAWSVLMFIISKVGG